MVNRRNIQGEFFDCTIQSYNDNGHGKHKIDYSLNYGISIPMLKYIEELRMIFENTHDDKSSKRAQRLEFLEYLMDQDVLINYFQYLTTWLNGGSNFPDLNEYGSNFETNKLIIITAGGNIITIFAKLLHDILPPHPPQINFNKFILEHWSLGDMMIDLMRTASYRLKSLINIIAGFNFSDFDYNILPNKFYTIDESNNTEEENTSENGDGNTYENTYGQWNSYGKANAYRNRNNSNSNNMNNSSIMVPEFPSDSPCGFYLFRVKTSFEIRDYHIPPDFKITKARQYCGKAGISRKKMNLFYPQAVQEDWLDNRALSMPNDYKRNKEYCRESIGYLLKIKEMIKEETINNVNACIELTAMQQRLPTDVDGAIEYIRSVNYSMNNFLKTLRTDIAGEQTGEESFEEWQEFLNNFSSLDSILSGKLPFVSVNIIKHLINSRDLGTFTDEFMDKRQAESRLPAPKVCTYSIIPTGLHRLIRHLKAPMDSYMRNQPRPPIDGLRISFNNIIIEPREFEGEEVPKIYAEEGEFDELAQSFEQLSIQMLNRHLPAAANAAHGQLYNIGVAQIRDRKKKRKRSKLKQSKLKQSKLTQSKLKQSKLNPKKGKSSNPKTKRSKSKRSKSKQSKSKQSKSKRSKSNKSKPIEKLKTRKIHKSQN